MNLFQNTNQQSAMKLNSQLSEFGLHPSDWRLIHNSNTQIKIQHKQESSFYFLGSIHKVNGKNVWKKIRLASL